MNGLYALTITMIVYAIGDMVATKTKAIISMLFVASVLFALGFWNDIIPASIFQDSALAGFASVTVGLLLVHMGSTIQLKDFLKEWKTVIIVLASTVAICLGVYFVGGLIIDKYYALIGAPILGGGVVAFLVMSDALKEVASSDAIVFGSLVLIAQGIVGFPIASILCRKEALRLKGEIATGNLRLHAPTEEGTSVKKKLFPPIPQKYNGDNLLIAKLALLACLAQWLSGLTGGNVNMLVICLVLGVITRELGLLDEGALTKANGFTFVIGAVVVNVFGNLATTTPAQVVSMIGPLAVTAIVGLVFCALVSILVGKIFKQSWYMSFAMGVTALVGFPGTMIIPTEVAKAAADSPEEQEIILQNILPKMIIAGMVSVSIVSVFAAGVMASWV